MHFRQWKRREFITLIGGAAAWPLAARAQQRMRRIGLLMGLAKDDPEGRSRLAALARALQDLGWIEGHNIRTDYRWAAGDIERTHILATELVRSAPDAIVVNTPPGLSALQGKTHTIPIVFVQVLDASESAIVINPVRPKANVTGFTNFYEYAVSGKWLSLLKEIAPSVLRVTVMQNPNHPSWVGYQRSIAAAAPLIDVQPVDARIYTPADLITPSMSWCANQTVVCSSFRTLSILFIAPRSSRWLPATVYLRCIPNASMPLMEV
jgi:putative ABC transport system substrate-binding protein